MARREAPPQRKVAEDDSGGAFGWEDEADRAEQESLFAALGMRGLYQKKDLFGELFIETAQEGEPDVFSNTETNAEMDAFTTTLTWFVLATVACEVEAIALGRR
jgi:hypothetical protein